MLLAVELADKKVWIAVGFCVLLGNTFVGRVAVESSLLEILPIGLYHSLWLARCHVATSNLP